MTAVDGFIFVYFFINIVIPTKAPEVPMVSAIKQSVEKPIRTNGKTPEAHHI